MQQSTERWILYTLAAVQFTHIMDFMIMMPLGPQLMRTMDISPAQFGLLVSSYTYSAGLFSFLAAFFIDRFERKPALILVYTGFIIGTLTCGLVNSYESLMLARILTGMFGGSITALIMVIISDVFPVERRATAMGTVMAAFSIAAVFGVPAGLLIANFFDWHAPFFLLVLLSAIIWMFMFLKIPPISGSERPPNQTVNAVLNRVFSIPDQRKALVFMFILVLGNFTIIPYIAPYLVANVGVTEAQLSLIYLVGGAFTFFSQPAIGRWADRRGLKRIFRIMAITSLIPIWLLTNLPVINLIAVLVVTSLLMVTLSGRMVPGMTLVTSTVKPQNRGSFMSVTSSFQQLSAGTAALIGGFIIQTTPDERLIGYDYAGYFGIACSLIAIVLSRRIKVSY